ncbi:hypothetical protein BDV93DRAFT_46773 [Ceratobasidium sp. AG-I]|nr:hypothetical protein BDV93DRAFT_46773 [Ceratobasidium sp. AG-I]
MSEDGLEDDSFTLEFELSLLAVDNRLLVVSSGEESHPDSDLESLDNGSNGTRGDDESDFGACPIYASDCRGFSDSSSDMSLDFDSEDLDCVDVEHSTGNDNGRTTPDLEQWKFTFTFGLSKISGVDEPHRPKVSRSSVERFSGRFIYGLAAETCGSNSNVAIPSSKRRRLVGQLSEVNQ